MGEAGDSPFPWLGIAIGAAVAAAVVLGGAWLIEVFR